jgi:glucokinase
MSQASAGPKARLYGAIDLGGTKVRALVADLEGNVAGYDLRRSETDLGLESVLGRMSDSLAAAAAEAGTEVSALGAVGIASPGAIDSVRGVVAGAPQLPGWKDVPLVERMSERLGIPGYLENDATAAALGEHRYGAGRGTRQMLYITVSTGVGGGIIIDGDLYSGASGAAGELGHVIVDPDGPPCRWCGSGCVESFASGTNLARRGEELVKSGEAPVLAELARTEGRLSAETMVLAANGGDQAVREAFRRAGCYLGIAFAGFVNIFNPEAIVVGGGVARGAGELIMGPAREMMEAHAIAESLKHVRLEPAALGDRSGLLGMIARIADAVKA